MGTYVFYECSESEKLKKIYCKKNGCVVGELEVERESDNVNHSYQLRMFICVRTRAIWQYFLQLLRQLE